MITDLHVRNCATKIQHNLDVCYEVCSFVKPAAGMDTIINTARDKIRKLRSEDVVVIWGGANNISNNNTKVTLKHVCNFVKKIKFCDNEIAQQTGSYCLMFCQ
jgi:hypothetical protein